MPLASRGSAHSSAPKSIVPEHHHETTSMNSKHHLPELEYDPSGNQDNDDRDGDRDVQLGIHSCKTKGTRTVWQPPYQPPQSSSLFRLPAGALMGFAERPKGITQSCIRVGQTEH